MEQQQGEIPVSEVLAIVGELTIENKMLRKKIAELEQRLAAPSPNGQPREAVAAQS